MEIFPVTMLSFYRALLPTDDKQAILLVVAVAFWWFFAAGFAFMRKTHWREVNWKHEVGIPPSPEGVKKAKAKEKFYENLDNSIVSWGINALMAISVSFAIEGVIRLHLALYEGIFN